MRRILTAAVMACSLALITGCATSPPPVSAKVQQYYNENVASGKPTLPPPAPATNTVAFIGDSYTAGAGASPGAGFADLIAVHFKLKAGNFGQGGTGYVKRIEAGGASACGADVCLNYGEVADKVIALAPAIVVVSGGRNDTGGDPVMFSRSTTALFAKLRAGLPNARIIATSPVWAADEPPADAEAMRASVRAAVLEVGGTLIDLGRPLEGRPELITKDGVHPNDAGHRVLADTAAAAIQASGVKLG